MSEARVPIAILGLVLPERLQIAIGEGRWQGHLAAGTKLALLLGAAHPDHWALLGVGGIRSETESARRAAKDPRMRPIYGLADASEPAAAVDRQHCLVADRLLLIMVSTEEEVVALDYSVDEIQPCVVLSVFEGAVGERVRWLELAANFDDLADRTNL